MELSRKLFDGTKARYARANTEYQAKIQGNNWAERAADRMYQRAAFRVMERCLKAQLYLNSRCMRDNGARIATW